MLAEAHQALGQTIQALRVIDEAIEYANQTEEIQTLAESYRLKGEFLLKRTDGKGVEKAEACFKQSLEIARDQRAKSWELRTATSLAWLLRDRGERQQAHDLLAPIYNWFTEGFDTADLKAAKALLDALT